jgi:prepilin-type N-terminal cleavage/methylation domain-containing protein
MKNWHNRTLLPSSRGFTLIELMVVMVLISIVLAVVIPRFDGGPFQDPTKKLTRWMVNTIRYLRSTAIQKQTGQALIIDLNEQRMWIVGEGMSEAEQTTASEKAFKLDKSMQIVTVQFPDQEPISTGSAEIHFYPAGFSDRVLIQLENDDAQRFSYLVEPLLPKVKMFEEWIDI